MPTCNGSCYFEAIKMKRPGKLTKGVLFHQDNAPPHKSLIVIEINHDCGFELILTLAPSDFHLFPNMKKDLAGKNIQDNDNVISAARDYFDEQDEGFTKQGSKHFRAAGRSVWTARGTTLKNRQQKNALQ